MISAETTMLCKNHNIPYSQFCREEKCRVAICSECIRSHFRHAVVPLSDEISSSLARIAEQKSQLSTQLREATRQLSETLARRRQVAADESAERRLVTEVRALFERELGKVVQSNQKRRREMEKMMEERCTRLRAGIMRLESEIKEREGIVMSPQDLESLGLVAKLVLLGSSPVPRLMVPDMHVEDLPNNYKLESLRDKLNPTQHGPETARLARTLRLDVATAKLSLIEARETVGVALTDMRMGIEEAGMILRRKLSQLSRREGSKKRVGHALTICFGCGKAGHFTNACPSLLPGGSGK
ncbi:MAG: hypothetical protein P4L50_10425 [Anaerolineaceae bacterium]|nr:hypothetical protein [Anaerolineaceae bacterium]